MILLDTNVLVYAVDGASAPHRACSRVVRRAMAGRLDAVLVPQVLTEFCAVVTSSRRVRTALSPAEAIDQVDDWIQSIPIRYPTARCLDEWAALVRPLQRRGQDIHDLFVAAQMRAHGIQEICTLNVVDFAGIDRVVVRTPDGL